MTDVKENFKTSLESHTVLAPLITLKTETGFLKIFSFEFMHTLQ